MRRTPQRCALLLCALAALLTPACAGRPRTEPHPGLASLWETFEDMPPERALAIAGDPDRGWVGGASGGHESQEEARESAIAECRRRRAARRMRAPCRLYASGDAIVWRDW